MKKHILIILTLGLFYSGIAQTLDTVSVGAGYANEVWYSLDDDSETHHARSDWDLAFSVGGRGAAIHTNGGNGVELRVYQGGDTSAWASLDTVGISSWPILYNTDTSWAVGAFNSKAAGGFDYGWGNYSLITHFVTADSLYVLKLANGSYKKLWLDKLASGVYYFKHADLNGEHEQSATVTKTDYVNKNFAYYSLANNTVLDREPDNTAWDLLFTKYVAFIPIPYGVTGILTNSGTDVAKVSGADAGDLDESTASYSQHIATVGWDWKSFNGMGYSIVDSIAFFVKSKGGSVYKIVPQDFGGSASGNFIFTREVVQALQIEDNESISDATIFPNPAVDVVNVLFNAHAAATVQLSLISMNGATVHQEQYSGNGGLNKVTINVQNLSPGVYLLNIQAGAEIVQQKVVIK
jgi:hypothetical protein